jgi:hypothetical protein
MKRAVLGVMTGVSVFGLLAAGCASRADVAPKPENPDSYADGFEDGCFSGNKAGQELFGQFMKDLARFDTEKNYALGWSDGFRQCETEQEALDRKARVTNYSGSATRN